MNHKRMVKRWKFSWMGHEYHAGRDKDGILWVRYGVGGWEPESRRCLVNSAW